ncbi:type VI secretion protein [Acinetobacter sp. Marseille-Q1618]|uniref:type VI secretion protein n=1 Tax=Acinetobacter sp. Marseille-Q1618 TaxID=2697502 RepID=UPI00156D669C|nr:type VI secretion protein [Acinetobacter sp. Marseille-Q1618]
MDFIQVLQNSGTLIVASITIARYLCVVLGFIVFVRAILDMIAVSDPVNATRFMTTVRRPSASGVVVKLIIAMLLVQLGLNLQLVDVMGSLLNDTRPNAVTYYDYSQTVGNSYTAELSLTILVVIGICQLVGIMAMIKGLLIWRDNSDGIGKSSNAQGFVYILGGMLSYKIEDVHALVATIFGLDFFKIIGLS